MPEHAPCPITGEASRRVQTLSVKYLKAMWRFAGASGLDELYGEITHFGLYESPSGLMFFHPMIPGDDVFYESLYARVDAHRVLGRQHMRRVEFLQAASLVPAGASVLDVGCGAGHFRAHLGHARYQGVDLHGDAAAPDISREPIGDHAARWPEAYDLVCAFQVIEHVADPLGFVRDMLRALRPGGTLILCAPLHPSPLTEIPNNLVNGPPHHLTWWNVGAFGALCAAAGLEPLRIEALAPSPYQAGVFWARRLMPFRTDPARGVYYAARRDWSYSLAAAFLLQALPTALFGLPRDARPVDVFLAARKPG